MHPLCSSPANLPTWYEIQTVSFFTKSSRKTALPNVGFKGVKTTEAPTFTESGSKAKVQKKKPKVAESKEELS